MGLYQETFTSTTFVGLNGIWSASFALSKLFPYGALQPGPLVIQGLKGFDFGYEAMMAEFDRTIGLQYLRGMHLNDAMRRQIGRASCRERV